jgi:transcriptional regulator with XRE-family HTH domain
MGKRIEDIVAENVAALMQASRNCGTDAKLASRSGIGRGTVQRVRRAEVSVSVGNLAAIAAAYDLQPWQLLLENLDPTNPPALKVASETERRLWAKLRVMMEELAAYKVGDPEGAHEQADSDRTGHVDRDLDRNRAQRSRRKGTGGAQGG